MHKFIKKIGPTKFSLSKSQRLVYVEEKGFITDISQTPRTSNVMDNILANEKPVLIPGLRTIQEELTAYLEKTENKPNTQQPNIMGKILGGDTNNFRLPETNPERTSSENIMQKLLEKPNDFFDPKAKAILDLLKQIK